MGIGARVARRNERKPAQVRCQIVRAEPVLTSISISVHSLLLGSDAGIALNGTSSLLLAGDLTLTGGLSASGNVTLEGANLAVGAPFTQAQGELSLQLGSTLSASQVTIDSGATLFNEYGGGGTIAGNLVNDGSVETGSTTGVNGNYTQAPGASLFLRLRRPARRFGPGHAGRFGLGLGICSQAG